MTGCVVESAGPLVRVLGPVCLDGAQGVRPDAGHVGVCTELVAYLALVPDVSGEALEDALWPLRRGDAGVTRCAAVSRARGWLGDDPVTGAPYLPRQELRLEGVRTDWGAWRELVPGDPVQASTHALTQALRLVRGRPLDGTAGRAVAGTRNRTSRYGYAWGERLRQTMTARVLDAAQELAVRHLAAGDWAAADEAAALGISLHPGIEALWRARIVAAYRAHNRPAIDEAIARLEAIVQDDFGDDFEPETVELLDAIRESGNRHGTLDQLLEFVG